MISTGEYRKSTFSSNGNCVEVRRLTGGNISVRDSKNPRRSAHEFTPQEWVAFLAGVRNGEFDLA